MPPSVDKWIKGNEKVRDQATPIHQGYPKGEADFFREGGNTLDSIERKHLPDIMGKKVAHVGCNCGQDTVSLASMGGICTGFDQSGRAIGEAVEPSRDLGVKADFVKANALDIPSEYNGAFDLVYISREFLAWIPDMEELMKSLSRLLARGGEILIYDQHPFVHMFDSDFSGKPEVAFSYFNRNPQQYEGLDYIGGSSYEALPNYQFMVSLSGILTGLAEGGMVLTEFLEFEHTFFEQFPGMVRGDDGLYRFPEDSGIPSMPLMMLLKARKS